MNDFRISSFPPIVDDESKVLVLGTMPGAESLRQQRYYAFERNQFWTVLFALFDIARPDEYEKRVLFLLDKKIALWDVLDSCMRNGSADSKIRFPKPNSIPELLERHPNIGAVFLNGKGAAALFNKHVLQHIPNQLHIETLPSTSPAYTVAFEHKLDDWKKLSAFLSKSL